MPLPSPYCSNIMAHPRPPGCTITGLTPIHSPLPHLGCMLPGAIPRPPFLPCLWGLVGGWGWSWGWAGLGLALPLVSRVS